MSFIFTIFIIGLILIVHELSHAIAMDRNNIELEEISIGIKTKFLGIGPFSHPRVFSGTRIYLSPFLIYAYVKPTDNGKRRIESLLSHSEKVEIYGAGILGNFVLALCIIVAADIAFGLPDAVSIIASILLAILSIAILIRWTRKILNIIIIPIIGLLMMILLGFLLFSDPMNAMQGPVSMIEKGGESSKTILDTILFGASLSLGIGLFNALPFMPLDGGHIFHSTLQTLKLNFIASLHQKFSIYVALILVGWAIVNDIFKALGVW